MTARQKIDEIIDRIKLVPTLEDKDLHEEDVRAAISSAFNQILSDLTMKGFVNLSLYERLYKGSDGHGVDVSLDSDTGKYYSILPVGICALADVKSGVRSVSPLTADVDYVPVQREQITILNNLLGSEVDTTIGYTVGRNSTGKVTIDYYGMTSANNPSKVKMYLILSFESYDDNDEVNIPAGQDERLFEAVIKTLVNNQKSIRPNG
jgi:hypothetical protein